MRLYRISAQLLIAELLYIPDGPVRLARMLRELPNCWNWQTAFLQAFGFQRLLDAEKWWSVAATAFMGRDPTLFAPKESCLARLDEIMRASANVRVSTNALPVRAEATLLQVISEWDYLTQRVVLQQKLVQLIMLRASAPVSIVDIIDAYRECLRAYLQKRDLSGYAPENKRQVRIPGPLLAREAVRQLQMLDERRAALRQEIGSAPGVAVSGAP